MRRHAELAYVFPSVETALKFAADVCMITEEPDEDIELDAESFCALLETTGSEVRKVKPRKRVVRFELDVSDDGCHCASEAAHERGNDRDFERELESALETLVSVHDNDGAEGPSSYEDVKASTKRLRIWW